MYILLAISIFYICYGLVGLLGFQLIPKKYRGHSWTKQYKRCCGLAYLLLGIPWLLLTLAQMAGWIGDNPFLAGILLSGAIAFCYCLWFDRKYKQKLSQ